MPPRKRSRKGAMVTYRPVQRQRTQRYGTVVPYAPKAAQLAAARRALRSEELKFHDFTFDDTNMASVGSVEDSVNHIAQGITEKTRIGRKCTIKKIGWRLNVGLAEEANVDDVGNGDVARIILYLDKQANGATAAVTDLLETADFQSFNNLANKGRFRVLMDRTYSLNRAVAATDGTNTATTPEVNEHDTFWKDVNIPIEFDNTASAGEITTIRSNNIGILTISKNGIAFLKSEMRLRFLDG